jgi:dethiobiotin synthetase
MKGYFIAGTDTGVGKTRVTAGLISAFRSRNVSALGMKPVACGLLNDNGRLYSEDVDIICRYSGQDPGLPDVNPYAFQPPVSPHIASKLARRNIEISEIRRHFSLIAANDAIVVVEGAGGWETPISDTHTMADVARSLGLPVILVVGLRLGCLNHALLTARSISAAGLPLAGWIGNRLDEGFEEPEANLDTLRGRLGSEPLAVLPYSHSMRSALPALGQAAERLLGASQRS